MGLFSNIKSGLGTIPRNVTGRPMSIMGIQPRFQSSILPRQPQSREEYNQMAQEGTLFGGQPLQEPIAMPRNPEMVEQINQQMFPQPIPQVPSPLQNASDNIKRQIEPQPFLQQPQAPQTGGIPVTGGGPLGSGILPVDNLPSGTPPVMGPALGSFKIPTGPAKGGIRGIPGVGTDPSNTDLSTLPSLIPSNPSTLPKLPSRSILDDFVPPPGYKEGKVGNNPPPDPAAGLKPLLGSGITPRPSLDDSALPPKRNDFMSIAQDPNAINVKRPASIGGFGGLDGGKSGPGYDSIGMPTVENGQGFFDPNYSPDKLNLDKYRTNPSSPVNFGNAIKSTTPLPGIGGMGDVPTDDMARFPEPQLQATPAPSLGGMGGGNEGTVRSMEFRDTDMNGVDDRDQPDFGGPSQEYLDQQERIKDMFGGGTLGDLYNPGLPQAPTDTGPETFSVDQQNPFEPEPTMFTPPQNPATAPTPPAAPAPVVPPVVAPPVPVTPPQSTAAATNTPAPAPAPAPTAPAPTDPAAGTTTTPGTTMAQPQSPYVSNLIRNETGMDATTKQLLFGLDGKGGFIPGAMQASENTFFNPDGTPRVVAEQVAGLSPDQLAAQQLNRQSVGMQDPYLAQAQDAYTTGIGQLGQGLEAAQLRGQQALDTTRLGVAQEEALRRQGLGATLGGLGQGARLATDATSGLAGQLGDVEGIQRSAADRFQRQSGGVGLSAMGATDEFGNRLGESESLLRGTTGAYDPSMTQQFYDPYEDAVVDQVSKDLFKQYDRGDISARASDIARGGESAFGSRARLGAGERAEALGRGLAEAIGGIRSRGFQQAQQTGLSEFARQRQAERSAASGLSGLAGSRLGAQQQLGGTLRGLSGDQLAAQQNLASGLGNLAGQRYQAGTNLGSTLAGYGSQAGSALGGAGQSALGSANQLAGAYGTMGGIEGGIGQTAQQAMFGLGSNLQGLGQQAQGARTTDISNLYGMGQGQQAQYQAQLDAARRNALTAQQAPLAQYQALAPFIQMAPQGQFNTQTTFAPRPSALQAGLGVGLSSLGAMGQFMNQGKT